jgi:phosphoglycolate phosphatase
MMQHNFKAIFFDWDGTLVDSLHFLHTAHNHVREELGEKIWSLDEFKGMMKYSSLQLYPKIYGDRAGEGLEILKAFMADEHLKYLDPMAGAAVLLDHLHQSGVPMGLVSNKRHMFVVREVEHAGWGHYFKAVIGAGEAANDKPSADPLILALSRAGLQPGPDILYVGDTEADLECAANAGCTQAFLYHASPDNPLISKHNPDISVQDCGALQTYLTRRMP